MRVFVAAPFMAVLLILGLNPAWGETACPQASAALSQCPKPVKPVKPMKQVKPSAKPLVAVAVPGVAAEPAPTATSWKATLDPLPAGGWVLITDGPLDNPSVVYASTHNVLRNGNVVTAWIRWEYSRIQAEIYPLHYQSAVTHEELDCDSRSYRRGAVFYYRRNNLQDKALQFTALDDDTNWKLAIPGTEGDAMLNWACAPPVVAVAHHTVRATQLIDKPEDKSEAKSGAKGDAKTNAQAGTRSFSTAAAKSRSAAAAPSSAPSSAPAAAGGGIDLHTNR